MNLKNSILIFIVALFFGFLLVYGESGLNLNSQLILELRLPKVLVCLLAGGTLAISGLIMQIFFQNPLAGPDILGVSSGASLFVAFWMMAATRLSPVVTNWGMSLMSFLGALSVLVLLLFFLTKNMSKVSLIIVGLLISSFAGSGISILVNKAESLTIKNYLLWSMGSFRNVTSSDLNRFVILSLIGFVPVLFLSKILNQMLLSENYAISMGVNVKKIKILLVILSAFQISVVTSFCGPIGFIGIISPHLARIILKRAYLNNITLATFLIGAFLALLSEGIITCMPSFGISINAVLGLIGAPVIVIYLYRHREWSV